MARWPMPGCRAPGRDQVAAVQVTLEAAGIEFPNGDALGVRLRPKKRK
jgi:hypothetical protein